MTSRVRLKKVYRGLERGIVTTEKFRAFVFRELDHHTDGVPLRTRISLLRRGFHSTRCQDYQIEREDLDEQLGDYIPDFSGYISPGSIGKENASIATNKLTSHQLIGDYDALPEVYGVIDCSEVVSLRGKEIHDDAGEWLIEQISKESPLFAKPTTAWGGMGAMKVDWDDGDVLINSEPVTIEEIRTRFDIGERYLVTEHVQQTTYSDEIWPHSANTIRVWTMWDPEDYEPFIGPAIHRFGADPSVPADNWDKGGLSVNVDTDNGILTTVAHNSQNGVKWVGEHPITGTQITGTNIPYWGKTCELLLDLASELRQLPLIAWDVVITDEGPMILELNTKPTHDMMQIHEGILADPRVRKFLEHHGVV